MNNESNNPEDNPDQPDLFGEPDEESSFAKKLEEKLKKQIEDARANDPLSSSITDLVDQLLDEADTYGASDSAEVEHLRAMLPFIEREEAKQAARDKKLDEALTLLRAIASSAAQIAESLKGD